MLNLTQHAATPDQKESGVIDLLDRLKVILSQLLTFESIPTQKDLVDRGEMVAALATTTAGGPTKVMIGGAPFFMSALEKALQREGHTVHYAFSKRESVDQPQPDGTVKKVAVFKHAGFVSTNPCWA